MSSRIRKLIRRNVHGQSEVPIFVIACSVIFKTALNVLLKYVFVFKPNCFPSIKRKMQDLTAFLVKTGIKTFGFKVTMTLLSAAKEIVACEKSVTIFRALF